MSHRLSKWLLAVLCRWTVFKTPPIVRYLYQRYGACGGVNICCCVSVHSLELIIDRSVDAYTLVKCHNYAIITVILLCCIDYRCTYKNAMGWIRMRTFLFFITDFQHCFFPKQKQILLELGRQKLWEWSFGHCECGWLLGCFLALWGLLFRLPIFLHSILDYESYYNNIIVHECASQCWQAVVYT